MFILGPYVLKILAIRISADMDDNINKDKSSQSNNGTKRAMS